MNDSFRVDQLPPYILGEIGRAVLELRRGGADIVDLSQFNPDLGPPQVGVDKAVQSLLLPHHHRYSSSQGISKLRQAFADWYLQRFGVALDPEEEVAVTLGTKEGLSHLLLAVVNPGDHVLVPTPSYPIHNSAVMMAASSLLGIPLFSAWSDATNAGYKLDGQSDDFFARLESVCASAWPKPKAMIICFPHNPTGTTVDTAFFTRLVEFAASHQILLIHDFAYGELCYDGYRAPSLLEIPGAIDTAVEFYSMSKAFSIPGWRISFCVGNKKVIRALKRIKSHLDYGVFQPLQIAAISLLKHAPAILKETAETYRARRDVLVDGLKSAGFDARPPRATVFLWLPIPDESGGSLTMSHRLLKDAGVAVSPGLGFDPHADGFIRIALSESEQRLRTAAIRIERALRGGR